MFINFNLYGFILGLAIITTISLIEKQYKKLNFSQDLFWKIIFFSFMFGIFGARLWHVLTDFNLYKDNLIEALYIWNGGLSIFGGLFGSIFGAYLSLTLLKNKKSKNQISFLEFIDIAVFGIPIGQVIGRLGNYFNQELYGIPADDSFLSFFKIYIDPVHRISGFETIEYYHPIFFYEMILMSLFAFFIYFLNLKNKLPKIGTGKLFLIYVSYYSVVRFLLDFIRLNKTLINETNIGVNQAILILILLVSLSFWLKNKLRQVFVKIFIFFVVVTLIMFKLDKLFEQKRTMSNYSDGEKVNIVISDSTKNKMVDLNVEVANTQQSIKQGLSGREEIGSDGLLFIFPLSNGKVFWMYDMKFNLDFVWIKGNKVVALNKNISKPHPDAREDEIELISVSENVDKVLELNAGDIEKYQIELGDVVILK